MNWSNGFVLRGGRKKSRSFTERNPGRSTIATRRASEENSLMPSHPPQKGSGCEEIRYRLRSPLATIAGCGLAVVLTSPGLIAGIAGTGGGGAATGEAMGL